MKTAYKSVLHEKYLLLGLFIFSLLLRSIFYYTVEMEPPEIRADAEKYLITAVNLVDYNTYSYQTNFPLQSSTRLVPGYPLFLSAIYALVSDLTYTIKIAFQLQLFMSAMIPVFATLIARLFLPIIPALLIGLLITFHPHQIIVPSYLLTETLFSFLFISAIYFLLISINKEKWSLVTLAGLLLAWATLTRPITILLIPFLIIILWRVKQSLNSKIVFIAVLVFVCWVPWVIWSNSSADLKESNLKAVVGLGSYPDFTYQEFRGFPNIEDPAFGKNVASWDNLVQSILSRVIESPAPYIFWYTIGKPASLWGFDMVQGQGGAFIYPVKSSLYHNSKIWFWLYKTIKLIHQPMLIFAMLVAFIVLIKASIHKHKNVPQEMLIIASIVVYATLSHIPLASLPRFSIPFQPFAIMLAIATLYFIVNRIKTKKP